MTNLFWDSCVFNALLYDERDKYDVDSIGQYIDDSKRGICRLYTSSVVFAEIASSKIKLNGFKSGIDFTNDLIGSCVVVDASINILNLAGKLRDMPYKKGNSDKRKLTTGDAVMLATSLHLEEAFGVNIGAFHTFDNGGSKREVPLLSYEDWCEGLSGAHLALAERVINLPRIKPIHPSPTFLK